MSSVFLDFLPCKYFIPRCFLFFSPALWLLLQASQRLKSYHAQQSLIKFVVCRIQSSICISKGFLPINRFRSWARRLPVNISSSATQSKARIPPCILISGQALPPTYRSHSLPLVLLQPGDWRAIPSLLRLAARTVDVSCLVRNRQSSRRTHEQIELNFLVCSSATTGYYNLYLQTGSDTPSGQTCSNYQTIHLPCLC